MRRICAWVSRHDPTPVVRAPGEYDEFTDGFKWSGTWRRVVGFAVQTERFVP